MTELGMASAMMDKCIVQECDILDMRLAPLENVTPVSLANLKYGTPAMSLANLEYVANLKYVTPAMSLANLEYVANLKYVTPAMSLANLEYVSSDVCLALQDFVGFGEIVVKTMYMAQLKKVMGWMAVLLLLQMVLVGGDEEHLRTWRDVKCPSVVECLGRVMRRLRRKKVMKGKDTRRNNRKGCLGRMVGKRQIRVIVLLSMMGSAHAMTTEQILEQIARLADAATAAARAAGDAATQAATASASSSSGGATSSTAAGLESATHVLKAPDTFNGEETLVFPGWKTQFESWLTFGDSRFTNLLFRVEGQSHEPDALTYGDDQKSMSNKFYAILSSYLRGRCLQLVRANQGKDGFKLWYQLCRESIATTKKQALALAQTLANTQISIQRWVCLKVFCSMRT